MDTHGINFDHEMQDGIEKMFSYYHQWKIERDKPGNEDIKERYDPETEQLLRENLVSKVISVQQMFEKTEKKSRGNLWTKKRKAAIMSMAQITGILQRMADQKPKKKKKKAHKVPVAPPPKEDKPKAIPMEGYINLSNLLPRVDMNTMQTRSFRWSRERMTSLIENYVTTDHMKQNAKLEQIYGIKPALLKLDFTREVSLPIHPEWGNLPETQSSEIENELVASSESPNPKGDVSDFKHSQTNRRSSKDTRVLSSRMSQRIPSAASSKNGPSGSTSPRKMSQSGDSNRRLSKVSKSGARFLGVGFNTIEEESDAGSESDSTISPFGFHSHRLSPSKFLLQHDESISPIHLRPSHENGLIQQNFAIDKNRYYRKWWERKKKTFKAQVQFDCPDSPIAKQSKTRDPSLPKSPPYRAHLDLHQTFVGYNPEESLGKEGLEQYRKRRLEELFIDVKKFVDLDKEEKSSKPQSRRLHTVR